MLLLSDICVYVSMCRHESIYARDRALIIVSYVHAYLVAQEYWLCVYVCVFGRTCIIGLCVYIRVLGRACINGVVCVYAYSVGTCAYAPSLDLWFRLSHRFKPKPLTAHP